MKIYSLTLLIGILFTHLAVFSQHERKQFEKGINKAISRSYDACVKISEFDTLRQANIGSQFSGVSVTAEGHILTVAHAAFPGRIYKLYFPDGKTVLATGLGRIGSFDAAVLKIKDKGRWPYAPLGWSGKLNSGDPCIGISYPVMLDQPLPTVRFGYISKPVSDKGFIESSCKMEQGDSGGPLFDFLGRVIGLRSYIYAPEKNNFDVPVDTYRKYWTKLNLPVDYTDLKRLTEDVIAVDTGAGLVHVKSISGEVITKNLKAVTTGIWINSLIKGKMQRVLSTPFLLDVGKLGKANRYTYLLSKNSMVGDHVKLELSSGQNDLVKILNRDEENDLVLMQVERRLKNGIQLNEKPDTVGTGSEDLGKFLISVLPGHEYRMSVLGSRYFSLSRFFSVGFFGAGAIFSDGKIMLRNVAKGSPAEKAGLKQYDQLTGVNRVGIYVPQDYGAELSKHFPEERISIQGVRDSVRFDLPVFLGFLPNWNSHPDSQFDGGRSRRLDGFKQVLVHDAIIKPEECGGPVYDADGNFYGINIARFSRTGTLIMPSALIYNLINSMKDYSTKHNRVLKTRELGK
ncbi:serine protease Do [Pedobacter steynii]|uniref:Serine protease Do n=2 Tax=Pedobacter steynii TaxID=430522 RepID=A0A1G9K8Y5_9SPHI|nr:serine protease Do [Pedobacter steynii]